METYRRLLLLGLLLSQVSMAAPQWESHRHILQNVKQYLLQVGQELGETPRVRLGNIDRRLRLPKCDFPLETQLAPGSQNVGNVTVGVSCSAPKPWSIYVTARVSLIQKVVNARRTIPRRGVISAGDITLVPKDIASLPFGYFTDPKAVVGQAARRPIRAGTTLTPNMLTPPLLVERGESVTIISRRQSFEVRMEGTALSDGAEGERIRVRNRSSKRIIDARVVSPGIVEVNP